MMLPSFEVVTMRFDAMWTPGRRVQKYLAAHDVGGNQHDEYLMRHLFSHAMKTKNAVQTEFTWRVPSRFSGPVAPLTQSEWSSID